MNITSYQSTPLTREAARQWLLETLLQISPVQSGPEKLGIESEMFAFAAKSWREGRIVPVPLFGKASLTEALSHIAKAKPDWQVNFSDDQIRSLTIGEGDGITFEPGGQVEISTRPLPGYKAAIDHFSKLRSELFTSFEAYDTFLYCAGMNPWLSVEQIGLQMQKPRYRAMDEYFSRIGPFGQQMMRQTSTVQINLDYGHDDESLVKRYLAANLLAPIATAIFANSPFSNGQANLLKSYRARIWQGLDDSRTGFPDLKALWNRMDKEGLCDVYFERLLACEVPFLEKLNSTCPSKPLTLADWFDHGYEGLKPDLDDFKLHMSLYFPEVRLKGFFEIRSVDMQNSVWLSCPVLFYTALLYDEKSVDNVINLLAPYIDDYGKLWQASTRGLEDERLARLSQKIMVEALDGYSRLAGEHRCELSYQRLKVFVEHFTDQARCPADDWLELHNSRMDASLKIDTVVSLEDKWLSLV